MKNILLQTAVLVSLLVACGQEPKKADRETPANALPSPDSVAVVAAVQGFFDWYGQMAASPNFAEKFNFVDYSGQHPQLKPELLEKYLAEFVASGHCGQAFVQGERMFYRQCAEAWKSIPIDEVPPCLDADRYFCAQEDVSGFFKKAAVAVETTGADTATATLTLNFGPNDKQARRVFLKKEGGKWLVAGVECDMG